MRAVRQRPRALEIRLAQITLCPEAADLFETIGTISDVETIASGRGIRELARLKKTYGGTQWMKKKGQARIRLADGTIIGAELHWYEAHGVGRKELKIKRLYEA